jgi:hypothetical protein
VLTLRNCEFSKNDISSFTKKTFQQASKILHSLNHVICDFRIFENPTLEKSLHV